MPSKETQAPKPIAEAGDGEEVVLRGTIKRARPTLLVAPLSERPCVAWEVRGGLRTGSRERGEAVDFWIEDESGRLLVRPEGIEIEARAQREEEAISIVDADIADVEGRLRELKQQKKKVGGPAATKVHGETKHLRKLATLLYAIRAHARGNVHIGGTLEGQEQLIRARSAAFEDEGLGSRSLGLMAERYELVLLEDAEVEARGRCERGIVPAGIGAGGGYRDLPTCMQLVAPAGGALLVRGLGALAPVPAGKGAAPAPRGAEVSHEESQERSRSRGGLSKAEREDLKRRPRKGERGQRAALLLIAIALASYFYYLVSHGGGGP